MLTRQAAISSPDDNLSNLSRTS